LVRPLDAFPLTLLCASVCLGLIAASVGSDSTWEQVLGPIVLSGGAAALAGRAWDEGLVLAAWPLFALALAAASAGVRGGRARWAVSSLVSVALVPLLGWLLVAEGGSLSAALVAGGLVAAGALLSASVRIAPHRVAPGQGPYRDTWRSRNAN
jgi:hypothetical protein